MYLVTVLLDIVIEARVPENWNEMSNLNEYL